MFVFDAIAVGNRLLAARKRMGLTQMEVAERAELSGRTYAQIERGTVNMRIETFLRICVVLQVTPNELLIDCDASAARAPMRQEELMKSLDTCRPKERETAFNLLSVYLSSLDR